MADPFFHKECKIDGEVQFKVIVCGEDYFKYVPLINFQPEPQYVGKIGWVARDEFDESGGPDVVRDIVSKKRGREASREPQGEKRKRRQ